MQANTHSSNYSLTLGLFLFLSKTHSSLLFFFRESISYLHLLTNTSSVWFAVVTLMIINSSHTPHAHKHAPETRRLSMHWWLNVGMWQAESSHWAHEGSLREQTERRLLALIVCWMILFKVAPWNESFRWRWQLLTDVLTTWGFPELLELLHYCLTLVLTWIDSNFVYLLTLGISPLKSVLGNVLKTSTYLWYFLPSHSPRYLSSDVRTRDVIASSWALTTPSWEFWQQSGRQVCKQTYANIWAR